MVVTPTGELLVRPAPGSAADGRLLGESGSVVATREYVHEIEVTANATANATGRRLRGVVREKKRALRVNLRDAEQLVVKLKKVRAPLVVSLLTSGEDAFRVSRPYWVQGRRFELDTFFEEELPRIAFCLPDDRLGSHPEVLVVSHGSRVSIAGGEGLAAVVEVLTQAGVRRRITRPPKPKRTMFNSQSPCT